MTFDDVAQTVDNLLATASPELLRAYPDLKDVYDVIRSQVRALRRALARDPTLEAIVLIATWCAQDIAAFAHYRDYYQRQLTRRTKHTRGGRASGARRHELAQSRNAELLKAATTFRAAHPYNRRTAPTSQLSTRLGRQFNMNAETVRSVLRIFKIK